jgi:hypothetical protein
MPSLNRINLIEVEILFEGFTKKIATSFLLAMTEMEQMTIAKRLQRKAGLK